jgi:hypothetical protein
MDTAFAFSGGFLFTFRSSSWRLRGAIWLGGNSGPAPSALFCLALLVASLTNGAALLPAVPCSRRSRRSPRCRSRPCRRVLFAASVVVNVDAVMRPR